MKDTFVCQNCFMLNDLADIICQNEDCAEENKPQTVKDFHD